jgi:adenosylcobinamide kinase/adenosylcobinamide-phosphate guanylyltransferase
MGARDLTLVFGGTGSGKSLHAEQLVLGTGLEPVYVATAIVEDDEEMARRVAAHRARRGAGWTLVEAPFELALAIERESRPGRALLVEDLTLWLANLLAAGADFESAIHGLLAALERAAGPVVVVSNEVGAGGVAAHPLARRFADLQGKLNQDVAAIAGRVILVAAGLPLTLKPAPQKEPVT